MQKYVVGFLFSGIKAPEPSVVLIRKNKPDFQKGKLNGVGGKVEASEVRIDAMVREFHEETGVLTDKKNWRYVGHFTFPNHATIDVYSGTDARVFLHARTVEEEQIEKHSIREFHKHEPMPNLKVLVPACFGREIAHRCGAHWAPIDFSTLCE